MAKQRYINTQFWNDNYIENLDPIEKLLFLYFLTNPLTNISGVYEITLRRIAFDTGIDKDMVKKLLDRFAEDKKIFFIDGWIILHNFIKHQNYKNPKILKAIEDNLILAPEWIIGYIYPIHELSHLTKLNLTKSNIIKPNENEIKPETNLITKKEKNIHTENLLKIWIENKLPSHSLNTVNSNMQKKHFDTIDSVIKDYSENIWEKMIKDYATVLHSKDHFYNYTFTLWDFIARGYKKFLPELEPVKNFLDKKSTVDIFDYEEMPDAYDPTREKVNE